MKQFPQAYLASTDALLPAAGIDKTKWAVIACDQFTADPAYWQAVQDEVDGAPSTLRITLPEIYLDETQKRVPQINACMAQYLDQGVFAPPLDGFLLIRRQTSTGVRTGLLAALDLEAYDYRAGAQSPVRATEGTILARIPPRVAIRQHAPVELPHVMVLFDDADNTVLGPLLAHESTLPVCYDFDLMQGGGHICARSVCDLKEMTALADAFAALAAPAVQGKKYGAQAAAHPLLFAVGDGNHSLATAKAVWEQKKESGAQMDDPARFAMVELVNLHDESLAFEPIHRLLLGADVQDLAGAFAAWLEQHPGPGGRQTFCLHANGRVYDFETARGAHTLPVGTLQGFLDEYLQAHPQVQIDYIHDDDALLRLAAKPGHAGFLLPPIGKDAFFAGVAQCGALPRKTFSMGVSRDKRYYLEARKIIR